MNLKQEKITVDDIEFVTQQFTAMRGLELMGRLVKVLGPTFGALASANPDAEIDSLAPVLAVALKDFDQKELTSLVLDVLNGTTAHIKSSLGVQPYQLDSKEKLDLVFSGRLKAMFKVAIHAIKVNYGDFLDGSVLGAPQAQAPSGS